MLKSADTIVDTLKQRSQISTGPGRKCKMRAVGEDRMTGGGGRTGIPHASSQGGRASQLHGRSGPNVARFSHFPGVRKFIPY